MGTVQVPVLLHVDGTAVDSGGVFLSGPRCIMMCVGSARFGILLLKMPRSNTRNVSIVVVRHLLVLPFCCISFVRFDFVCVNEPIFGGYILLFSLCIDSRSTLSAI